MLLQNTVYCQSNEWRKWWIVSGQHWQVHEQRGDTQVCYSSIRGYPHYFSLLAASQPATPLKNLMFFIVCMRAAFLIKTLRSVHSMLSCVYTKYAVEQSTTQRNVNRYGIRHIMLCTCNELIISFKEEYSFSHS